MRTIRVPNEYDAYQSITMHLVQLECIVNYSESVRFGYALLRIWYAFDTHGTLLVRFWYVAGTLMVRY